MSRAVVKAVLRRSRTETFNHTISGLLERRVQLVHEAEALKHRLGEIGPDIAAIDRVLASLSYEGDLEAQMPRLRLAIYGCGELARAILDELRRSEGARTSRDIARAILPSGGEECDRRAVTEHTRRVPKALRVLKLNGLVHGAKDQAGNMVWVRKGAAGLLPNGCESSA